MQERFIEYYSFLSMALVSAMGIAGTCWVIAYLVSKSINTWINLFKLKPLFIEFLTYKNQQRVKQQVEEYLTGKKAQD